MVYNRKSKAKNVNHLGCNKQNKLNEYKPNNNQMNGNFNSTDKTKPIENSKLIELEKSGEYIENGIQDQQSTSTGFDERRKHREKRKLKEYYERKENLKALKSTGMPKTEPLNVQNLESMESLGFRLL
ncbi:uncharacterized protein LOC128959664 [Oppia nitens]|uniref:uncharacterized protein LOC128959664 n=1 Tax=Oppia nitens TaxID=1686743 RepID=UPI0023D9CC95|nr:uncharacterized protein LOC128959664 [Oppia nitens]